MSGFLTFDPRQEYPNAGLPPPKPPKAPKLPLQPSAALGGLGTLGGVTLCLGAFLQATLEEAVPPLTLDHTGVPCAPCPACRGTSFHQPASGPWTCSTCTPTRLPRDVAKLIGWSFCSLPPDPDGRLLAAAAYAVAGVTATSDEGELHRDENLE